MIAPLNPENLRVNLFIKMEILHECSVKRARVSYLKQTLIAFISLIRRIISLDMLFVCLFVLLWKSSNSQGLKATLLFGYTLAQSLHYTRVTCWNIVCTG